ncbi:hypothetical protein [Halobiforma nitratireducens]|uniref:Uncharacterized protein n=1 Tax=Halobiforma nitratireducens JCM 10879 TaxID=1227454 RepID=M0M0D1_9EURY|nr:hypothetical protein [Halobiforma nitratireducens]EMA37840.1 hypothetical protein C446_10455 [Halobiforma nitratireducens JCM 10879]
MPLTKLLGSKATRTVTVVTVLAEAKRAFAHGKRTRGLALLAVAVLTWKWTVVGLAAQGVVKLLRGGTSRPGASPT